MYGGSMFTRSAARDTKQGQAIQEVNAKWGEDCLGRSGRETIGIAVCKKKYNPFQFHVVQVSPGGSSLVMENNGKSTQTKTEQLKRVEVLVERLYGCQCHHNRRKEKIVKHGVRPGWQPFGVWSLKKALDVAKREEARLNREIAETGQFSIVNVDDDENDDDIVNTDDVSATGESSSENGSSIANSSREGATSNVHEKLNVVRTMRIPGNYTWKVRSCYDNIFQEIHGCTESETEEYYDVTNQNSR